MNFINADMNRNGTKEICNTEHSDTGTVYWITGLSGAGKSTLAPYLVAYLRERGRPVVQLDGDELRRILGQSSDYSRQARIEIGIKYFLLCKELSSQNIDVVIAAIGLYKELHEWVSHNILKCYTIFIDTPLEELERRDTKGLYAKVRRGEISNIAGVDMPVDFPDMPDIHICWKPGMTIELMTTIVFEKLKK